jgi:GNAT superfamily N-acetyltransferase
MRIYDLAGLPERFRPQLAAFALTDGDPPQDLRFIRRLQRWGHPVSDYYALYAVEGGEVLSRVESLQLPFTGRTGLQLVVGVSDVLTRPEGLGRGFARTLLRSVHRREVASGRQWSFLWTHRSWGAHRLYESMGYADVYSPPNALGPVRRRRRSARPAGYRLAPETASDGSRLERLLTAASRGRLGFVPRPPGSFRTRIRLGWRKSANHHVLTTGSRAVGYAHFSDDSRWNLTANEVAVTSSEHREPMLRSLEAYAGRRPLTFQGTSFVRDSEDLLRAQGYTILPTSHGVLMAKALVGRSAVAEDLRKVFTDPGLSIHRGDMF